MISFLFGFGFTWLAQAQPTSFPVPKLIGPVMDQVGVLNRGQQQQLSQLLLSFNSQGKAQIQVLVIDSLQGIPIEQASIQITDQWKLGTAKKDNGLLFLVSVKDRKMRFEVGQGLEGVIPDILAKQIQSDTVIPYFKAGKYGDGIVAGVAQLIDYIDADFKKAHPEMEVQPQPNSVDRGANKPTIPKIVIFFIFILIVLFGGGGRRGRGFFGGGSFGGGGGGGGWSGGGGGFSGGGASSDW